MQHTIPCTLVKLRLPQQRAKRHRLNSCSSRSHRHEAARLAVELRLLQQLQTTTRQRRRMSNCHCTNLFHTPLPHVTYLAHSMQLLHQCDSVQCSTQQLPPACSTCLMSSHPAQQRGVRHADSAHLANKLRLLYQRGKLQHSTGQQIPAARNASLTRSHHVQGKSLGENPPASSPG